MNKYYYRIDNLGTSNLFYSLKNRLNSVYNDIANGNDLSMDGLDAVIKGLQEVKERATKHEIQY